MRTQWLLVGAAALPLAGCGKIEMTPQNRESMAETACLLRAAELFPDLDGIYAMPINPTSNEVKARHGTFHALPAAGFSWTVRLAELDHSRSGELACSGSYGNRRIKEITYNGTTRRPAAGEVWSI